MKKYVSYCRVSTTGQERSGLGLEAQQAIIMHYASSAGGTIIAEFIETESGKELENRPKLREAIVYCQKHKAILIVAKLDRLSRDVEHIFSIQKTLKDQLEICDLPHADSLTLSVFAGLAQREREIISIRTRQALQAKKARGQKLGKPENFSTEGRLAGARRVKEKAQEQSANKMALAYIQQSRERGISYRGIAEGLNQHGFSTVRGKRYQKGTVNILFRRSQEERVVL